MLINARRRVTPTSLPGGVYSGAEFISRQWIEALKTNWSTKDIIIVGDSTTRGFGSGSGDGWVDAVNNSPPAFLAARLAARGFDAANDSWFASGNSEVITNGFATSNANNVVGASWITQGLPAATAGGQFISDSTGTSLMSYTSKTPCTGFLVHYRRATGSLSVQIDAESAQTWDVSLTSTGSVSTGIQRRLISAAGSGIHTLKLSRISGAPLIAAVEAVGVSNRKDVLNLGWAGSQAANWANSDIPTSPLPAMAEVIRARTAPIFLPPLGINDQNLGRTAAQFQADMQTIVSTGIAAGGLPLVVIHQATFTTPSVDYANAARTVAATNGCPCLDLRTFLGTWAQMQAAGYTFDQSSHLTAAGSSAVAVAYDNFLAWAVAQ